MLMQRLFNCLFNSFVYVIIASTNYLRDMNVCFVYACTITTIYTECRRMCMTKFMEHTGTNCILK